MDDQFQNSARRSRQFGIRQLMIITLIVAVVLGIGRVTVMTFWRSFADGQSIYYCFLCVAAILMTLPLLIAGMLPRFAVPAVMVCLILVGLATLWEVSLISRFVKGADLSEWDFIAINAITLTWVVAFLIAVRLCGYELAGRRALDAPTM